MAWTTADLTRLEEAMATGALSVGYADGKRVTYRSLEEMALLRDAMRNELGVEPRRPLRKVYAPTKGTRPGSLDRSDWRPS